MMQSLNDSVYGLSGVDFRIGPGANDVCHRVFDDCDGHFAGDEVKLVGKVVLKTVIRIVHKLLEYVNNVNMTYPWR